MHDGSAVVLHLDTRYYFTLSESGALLWKTLAESDIPLAPADLIGALTAEYDIDEQTARLDVESWLARMLADELLQPLD
jgi:hypothetical protein